MQRGIGEHYSHCRIIGCNAFAKASASFFIKKHDRLLPAYEKLFLHFAKIALTPCGRNILQHNGKWFCRAVFKLSEPFHCALVFCVTAKVKTAYAFDSDYLPCHDGFSCGCDSLSAFLFTAYDIDLRTAFVTAHRLGVITPCGRVGVLLLAVFAHWKVSHCGANSVIGHRVHNSEPWTALSTVYKRVEISSVCFVEKLSLTFFAHSDVRGYENIPFFLFAVDYLKAVKWWLVGMGGNYLHYHRTIRGAAFKGFFQLVHSLFTALCVYLNIRAFVCHSAAKSKV